MTHAKPSVPGLQGPTIPGDYQFRANFEGPVLQRFFHHQRRLLIDSLLPTGPDDVILDAGCGSGVFARHVADSGGRVIGVDANEDAVAFAQRTFGDNRLSFQVRPLHETRLSDESVTAILMFEVIEHLEADYLEKVAAEFSRILAPGGQILVTAPNYRSAWPVVEHGADWMKLVPALGEQHVTRTSVRYLRACALNKSARLRRVGTFNFFAPALSPLSWKLAERVARAERSLSRIGMPAGLQVFGLWQKPRTP